MNKRNKRKLIGTPGQKSENGFFGTGSNYLEYINKFGDPRIIMPWEEYVEVDALFIPGGLDLSPSSYGEIPEYKTQNQSVMAQFFFDHRLKNYVGKTAIWGTCAGFQSLAAFFGSKLTQDLLYHPQSGSDSEPVHEVYILDHRGNKIIEGKTKRGEVIYKNESVNSSHHQGIMLKHLKDPLIPLGITEEWNGKEIVELFRHKTLPIAGCQWHPERHPSNLADSLFNEILGIKQEELV